MISVLLVAAGLTLLTLGGDALVRGAAALAGRLGLSPMVIGLTVVGFGTSTPELLTSLQAAWLGAPGVAVGNVVGSNIANILLILGATVLIRPIPVARDVLRQDGAAVALSALLCLALTLSGGYGRLAGVGLLVALALYLVAAFRAGEAAEGDAPPALSPGRVLTYTLTGLAALVLGARLLVDGATDLARAMGISEAVIGLTVVAVGTSLPELAASVAAARRGETAMALGNVLGSNIFNILGVLGATALIAPIPAPAQIMGFDIWIMIAATAALLIAAHTGARLARWEGAALLAGYAAYLWATL